MTSRHRPELYAEGHRVIESGDAQGIVALLDSPNGLLQREAMDEIGKRQLFHAAPALERMMKQEDPFFGSTRCRPWANSPSPRAVRFSSRA